jgi:hypothetical protein
MCIGCIVGLTLCFSGAAFSDPPSSKASHTFTLGLSVSTTVTFAYMIGQFKTAFSSCHIHLISHCSCHPHLFAAACFYCRPKSRQVPSSKVKAGAIIIIYCIAPVTFTFPLPLAFTAGQSQGRCHHPPPRSDPCH